MLNISSDDNTDTHAMDDIVPPALEIRQYNFIQELGRGSFSSVWKILNRDNGQIYACKIFPKANIAEEGDQERFQREINAMAFLRHPCLVGLHDFFSDENYFYLILDYCGGGELFEYICDNDKLDEVTAAYVFKEIAQALQFCHSFGVAHRDLKPENVLIDKFPYIRISDFGLCGYISEQKLMRTFCGSPCYCAPECLCRVQYDGRKADIWSLGVILFAMVTGEHPWNVQNTSAMLRQILKAQFQIPSHVSLECQNLIFNLLRADPSERLTMSEILEHPWIELAKQKVLPVTLPPMEIPLPPHNPPSIEELSSASAKSSQRSEHGIISPFEDFDEIVPLILPDDKKTETVRICMPRLQVRSCSLSIFDKQSPILPPAGHTQRKPLGMQAIVKPKRYKPAAGAGLGGIHGGRSECTLLPRKIPALPNPEMGTIDE